jgi:hypothetical protein
MGSPPILLPIGPKKTKTGAPPDHSSMIVAEEERNDWDDLSADAGDVALRPPRPRNEPENQIAVSSVTGRAPDEGA